MRHLNTYADEVRAEVQKMVRGDDSLFPVEGSKPKDVLFGILAMGIFEDDDLYLYCVAFARLMYGYAEFVSPTTFWSDLNKQLEREHIKWGDTWRRRTIFGQQNRTMDRVRDYYDQLDLGNTKDTAKHFLNTAGNLYICIVRLLHPKYSTSE